MKKLLVVLLVLAAACGSASAERESSRPRVTTSTLAPPSLNLDAFPIPARPTDGEGLRCQNAVDQVVSSLGREAVVPAVCVDTSHPAITNDGGRFVAAHVLIAFGYPYPVAEESYRSIAAHELGHAWDARHLTDRQRESYGATRGISGNWLDAPSEDYADVFAVAAGEGSFTPNLVAPIPPGLIDTLRAEGLLPT